MRIFKLLIIIAVVAVAAFSAVAWLTWRSAPSSTNTPPLVVNSSNSNTVQTPPITTGDIPLDASISYRGVTFVLDSALRTDAFRRSRADDGQQFVVVFFKPFTADVPADLAGWVSQEVVLSVRGRQSQRPIEVGLPKLANQAGGFVSYQVPDDATGATLVFGPDPGALSANLGF